MPFSNRLVITAKCAAALINLPVGSGLPVEGRLIGQPGTPGQVLMLASSAVPLGRLPGTQTAGKFRAEVGFNQATLSGNVATTRQTEQFAGGLQRTTFTVKFNNRGDTVRVVTEGHLDSCQSCHCSGHTESSQKVKGGKRGHPKRPFTPVLRAPNRLTRPSSGRPHRPAP